MNDPLQSVGTGPMAMKIEMGIGWIPNPEKPGYLMSANPGDYAREIERLRGAMKDACDLLAERTQGSPARSAGHNARLRLEAALED